MLLCELRCDCVGVFEHLEMVAHLKVQLLFKNLCNFSVSISRVQLKIMDK